MNVIWAAFLSVVRNIWWVNKIAKLSAALDDDVIILAQVFFILYKILAHDQNPFERNWSV